MGGGVAAQLALVAGGGQQLAVAEDRGADRDVAVRLGRARLLDRQAIACSCGGAVGGRSLIDPGVCPPTTSPAAPVLAEELARCTGHPGERTIHDETTASDPRRRWPCSPRCRLRRAGAGCRDRHLAGARLRPAPGRGQVRGRARRGRTSRCRRAPACARRPRRCARNPRVAYAAPNYIATASASPQAASPSPTTPAPSAAPPKPPPRPATGPSSSGTSCPGKAARHAALPTSPGGIDAVGAWRNLEEAGRPGAEGITVAVLDTGIAYRDDGSRFLPQPRLRRRAVRQGLRLRRQRPPAARRKRPRHPRRRHDRREDRQRHRRSPASPTGRS